MFRNGFQAIHRHRRCVRWHWQAVLRKRKDPKTGKLTYQDWGQVIRGFQEPSLSDGTRLYDQYFKEERHIKPTEARRRLKSAIVHRRALKRVDDLLSYIQFTRKGSRDSKESTGKR